jgi:hypothetical protein
MYKVEMQYIPGNSSIWVQHLTPSDPIYEYSNLEEAQAKAQELQVADPTDRKYRSTSFIAV